jgi:hypothetical protein
VGRPEGNSPFERPARKWENSIKTDLEEIRWKDVGWIYLAQDVKKVMNLRVS